MQIRQRGFIGMFHHATGSDRAAPAPGEQDGQVLAIVEIAIAQRAAVEQQAIVEECAVAFLHRLQFADQVAELLDVEAVNRVQCIEVLRLLFVVRVAVVR